MRVSQTALSMINDDAGKLSSSSRTKTPRLFAKGTGFVKSIGKDAHNVRFEDASFIVNSTAWLRFLDGRATSAA